MKIADGDRQRKKMANLTNTKAGKEIKEILTKFVIMTNRMDLKIKKLVDNSPGTLGDVISTIPAGLQSEATALIALIDNARQNHKPTGT